MSAMSIISTILQLIGSLCFLLFGMKMMSDGIQKMAGAKMQSVIHFMTKNRFVGLLTGVLLTMLIQSSSVTTVMVVSFVNAGLMTLTQSVSVIFGANIGTTVTAWIVALFGFNFKLSAIAVPIFGIGYLITRIKKLKYHSVGNAIMGFALLFVALGWLSDIIASNAESWSFLAKIQEIRYWNIPIAVVFGIIVTALIHSSSAMTAVVITMAYNGLLGWKFSAAMIIGSNIGSTIDSIMAGFGENAGTNAKRASLVHVIFNLVTALFALCFLTPFTRFVDFIVPGTVQENITFHVAMFHTIFNVFGTVIGLPLVGAITKLVTKIIPDNKNELSLVYKFDFSELEAKESPLIPIVKAQQEIRHMADIAVQMFDRLQYGFSDAKSFTETHYDALVKEEDYLDQMQEQLTQYLLKCEKLNIAEKQRANLNVMLVVCDNLEAMSDDCMSVGFCIKKIIDRNYRYSEEDFSRLLPYLELTRQLLQFVYININKCLTKEQLAFAEEIENMIDGERTALRKVASNRLEDHTNVKAELLYIDLVRQIEKMGDKCFNIAEQLTKTR